MGVCPIQSHRRLMVDGGYYTQSHMFNQSYLTQFRVYLAFPCDVGNHPKINC